MNVVILKNEQIEIIVFRSNIWHKRIIRTMVHLKSMEHIERWQGCVYMKEIEKWSKSWAEISNKWHEYIDNFKKMCSSTQEIGEILRESNKDSAEQYKLKTLRKKCTTCASLVQWRVQYVAVRSCYLLPIISSFVCRELMLELCPRASTIFYFARFADCHFWYKLGPQRLAFTLTPDAHFQVPRRAHAYTQQPSFLRFTRHQTRICPQENRPSQMVGKRMSNCVAVKPTIAISATWLIRSWCCCSVLGIRFGQQIIEFDYRGYGRVSHAWRLTMSNSKLSWNHQRIMGKTWKNMFQSYVFRFMSHLYCTHSCCQLEDNFDPAPPSPVADGSMGSYPGVTSRGHENWDSCLGKTGTEMT